MGCIVFSISTPYGTRLNSPGKAYGWGLHQNSGPALSSFLRRLPYSGKAPPSWGFTIRWKTQVKTEISHHLLLSETKYPSWLGRLNRIQLHQDTFVAGPRKPEALTPPIIHPFCSNPAHPQVPMMPQVLGRNTMKELVTCFNCLLKVFSIYVCVCVLEGVFLLRLAEPLSSILGWCLEKTPFQRQKQKTLGNVSFCYLSSFRHGWLSLL